MTIRPDDRVFNSPEVAEILQIPEGTIRRQLHYGAVELVSGKSKGARVYSACDMYVIALANELIRHGYNADHAYCLAHLETKRGTADPAEQPGYLMLVGLPHANEAKLVMLSKAGAMMAQPGAFASPAGLIAARIAACTHELAKSEPVPA